MKIIIQKFWYRYNCFSLKKAPAINIVLLYMILPIAIVTYYLMYKWLPASNVTGQWYTLFVSKAIQSLIMSIIVYSSFKNTRHAGMSTAVILYFIFKLLEEVFGLSQKTPWIDTIFKLLILGLAFYSIKYYFDESKKTKN